MSSFKQLKSSDVITVPFVVNKQWEFDYDPSSADPHIQVFKGKNISGDFILGGESITNGHYERLIYNQTNQLFYHKDLGNISTSSLISSPYYESASGLRPTGSFFSFDRGGMINNFPTESNSTIVILSISKNLYGQRILPHSFILTSSIHNIVDDGNNNIWDITSSLLSSYVTGGIMNPSYFESSESTSSTHIGNIFYSEGIIVVTNEDYQTLFD